jgi:hypothetical protein
MRPKREKERARSIDKLMDGQILSFSTKIEHDLCERYIGEDSSQLERHAK